jgi:2-polyprenyl-6-methoxyphenol hydroxylase-like FAD-dependent oxidoreductase
MGTTSTVKMGQHAIVIGASVAGMLAARVLADTFERVTVIERDVLKNEALPRKSVPQAQHAHGLLAKGLQIMSELYPELVAGLRAAGATDLEFGAHVRWFHYGEYKTAFEGDVDVLVPSRPLLDVQMRYCLMALPNVKMRSNCSVTRLVTNDDHTRVTGVVVEDRSGGVQAESLPADLVIDASGRGSRSPQWLMDLGYSKPQETEVRMNVAYSSRIYRCVEGDSPAGARMLYVLPTPPDEKRGGVALPIEGNRWIVTLLGYHGEPVANDDASFRDFARGLPCQDIYNLITHAEPLSDVVSYKIPSSLRRHYEKMARFPDGYLVMGDALCSFNPIFGQGMTVASKEALALRNLLKNRSNLAGLARDFYRRATATVDVAWMLATGEDFRYPQTEGARPFYTKPLNWYVAKVHRASAHDQVVYGAFIDVMNMLKPPPVLFQPNVVWRVFKGQPKLDGGKSLSAQPASAVGNAVL